VAIQYVSDLVTYSEPSDTQTDYEATISISFCVENSDGSLQPVIVYTQQIVGGTSDLNAIELYNAARSQINDETLLAYAASLVVPPSGSGSGSGSS